MEAVGWLSALLFAVCGIPQALQCYRTKSAGGLNWYFLGTWAAGEALGIAYAIHLGSAPLLANYVLNGMSLAVMIYYKIRSHHAVRNPSGPLP